MASTSAEGGAPRRRRTRVTVDPEPVTSTAPRTCSDSSCQNLDTLPCSYVDATGAACQTGWCAAHVVLYFAQPFCTRHASAVAAVGENPKVLPALNDRGASLAHWVASDLDPMIRGILDRARDQFRESMLTGPVRPADRNGRPLWERGWWLEGIDGFSFRVAISADGQGAPAVLAYVNEEIVHRGVQPWIAHRLRGEQLSPTKDLDERRAFEQQLRDAIALGVGHRRPSRSVEMPLHGDRPLSVPPPSGG